MDQSTPGHRRRRTNSVTVAELMRRQRAAGGVAGDADEPAAAEVTGPMLTDWFEADPPEQTRFTEHSYPAARIPPYQPENTGDDADGEAGGETGRTTRQDADDATGPAGPAAPPGSWNTPGHGTSGDDDPEDDEPRPEHFPAPRSGTAPADTALVNAVLADTQHTDAPQAGARPGTTSGTGRLSAAGRIAGLAVAALALGGAVTTAWAMERTAHPQPPPADPRPEITGLAALRPDAVATRLGSQASTFTTGTPPSTATSAPEDPDTHPHSATGVVEQFYTLAGYAPARATGLLEPALLDGQGPELVRSWQRTRQVNVERVTETGADTVEATVRVRGADGRWLRIRQQVGTSGGDAPLIATVRVLSAQYG